MREPEHVIPHDRLPEGFAERVEDPPDPPARPRPAATIALLRPGTGAPEVLLLRRSRSAGFVPGAYVFPGGRVDAEDGDPELLKRLEGLDPRWASERLGLPLEHEPAALGFWAAALREAFEETGILVARRRDGGPPPTAAADPRVEELRRKIMDSEHLFPEVLDRLECRLDARRVAYIGHWITPVAEPRRYDARFFAAAVSDETRAVVDRREMTDHAWITPREALERFRAGSLPMIFPTVKTLEELARFSSPEAVLHAYRRRAIPTRLPRLVRTEEGVGTVLERT